MKRRISTTEIDRFFDQLKEQSPIYTEEKVHQIINSPEAKARLTGKNKNLLKFTMMTTLFAVILSAVLLWTGHDNENQVSSIKTQDSGKEKASSIKCQESSALGNEAKFTDSKSANNNLDNSFIAIDSSNNNNSGFDAVQQNATVSNIQNSIYPTQQAVQQATGLDSNTIKTTDGSKFVLRLSNDELEKIGIRMIDKSIVYKNVANGYCYEDGSRFCKAYIQNAPEYYSFLKDEKGRKYSEHYVGIGFSRKSWIEDKKPAHKKKVKPEIITGSIEQYSYYYEISDDTIVPTQHNFYPVFKSNEYFGNILENGTLNSSDFEMANDTLVPIVFPKTGRGGDTEEILWFVLTNQLYEILSVKHKPLMDELIQYKTVKKRFPQKDIIEYRSPFLIDESRILKLSQNELQNLGFGFYADSMIYSGRNSRAGYKVMFSERQSTTQTMKYDYEGQIPELVDGCLALFVTDNSGNPLFNSLGLLPVLFPNEDEIYKQIPLLIPVEVKGGGFYNSLFFWFLPSESFFKAISKEVSNEIKAEYDYVVAEDKSQLEKPVCKYFDECKNTLKVSSFKVYPNPVNNEATVSFTLPETIEGRISLSDLSGHERQLLKPQTNYAKGQHSINVDLSNVPEGIYLLTLYSNKGVQTQRVIVAR